MKPRTAQKKIEIDYVMSYIEIGRILKLSSTTIRAIEQTALKKLSKHINLKVYLFE